MLVVLEPSFFEGADDFQQASLIGFVVRSRHKLVVSDETSAAYIKWRTSASPHIISALDQSQTVAFAVLTAPSSSRIGRISVNGESIDRWDRPVPSLSINCSLDLLARPVLLFVENNSADRNFLLRFMTHEERAQVIDFQSRGWLYFVHGGGIGDLRRQVADHSEAIHRSMRPNLMYALCDSDALLPGGTSLNAKLVSETCASLGIPHHCLARRNIENYITRNALAQWCDKNKRAKPKMFRRLQALFRLTDAQRHHFNVKKGLAGDEDPASKALYRSMGEYDRGLLKEGFGTNVSSCFEFDGWITRKDLEEDNSWVEMRSTIDSVLRMG